MDLDRLASAGFYDPDWPDAEDRRAVFAYFDEQGIDVELVLDAFRNDWINGVTIEKLLLDGSVSIRDAAAERGIDLDEVVRVCRLLGLGIDDVDAPALHPDEATGIAGVIAVQEMLSTPEIDEVLRTASSSLTTIAESLIGVFVGGVEQRLDDVGGSFLERAEVTTAAGHAALDFGGLLGLVFRHHLRQAIHRQRASMTTVDRNLRTMAVGFVDLVGFTQLSAGMGPDGLVAFMADFEARSFDIAAGHGGRIVKSIGDEVMFAALEPDVCAAIALDLIDAFDTGGMGTGPRGGMAAGHVVARLGDVYGPVVNTAARLVAEAVPGEVLADAAAASMLGEAFVVTPAGRRMLKGFDEPLAVSSVVWGAPGQGVGRQSR